VTAAQVKFSLSVSWVSAAAGMGLIQIHVAFFLNFISGLQQAHAQLRIMAPSDLKHQFGNGGKIEGTTATFGAPFYGERILGRLVYGEPKSEAPHCSAEDYDVPTPEEVPVEHHHYKQVRLIHIILVRRGACSFVTKAKVAAAKGAHAVVIVDRKDSDKTSDQIRQIIMSDDGYGSNVQIPSILISKQEGQLLIDKVKERNGEQVIVELAWDVPTDNVVQLDMWMSSGSTLSQTFLKEFAPNRMKLNEMVKFIPHFWIYQTPEGQNDYNDMCTRVDGEYCAEVPVGYSITGKEIINEDVRQLCIHKKYTVKRTKDMNQAGSVPVEYAREFWEYVEKYGDRCPLDGPTEETKFGKKCSENVMRDTRIDIELIEKCVDNEKMDLLKEQRTNHAWSSRALRVNGWRYSGTVDADLVTRAICSGFVRQPAACLELAEPKGVERIVEVQRGPPGVSFGTVALWLIGVSMAVAIALFLYKRSMTKSIHSTLREEVMLEVQAQMDSYRQMDNH
jgi:hypothetical protein